MTICFYGEFDAFTGAVPHRAFALPALVNDLRALLLLHEGVVVPPGSLIEHPLTLPAFRRLAPFVRAGLLGTSGDVGTTPLRVIAARTEKSLRRGMGVARGARWQADAIEQVCLAWQDLLPERFTVVRNVAAITEAYTASVGRQLQHIAENGGHAAARLSIALDRALQRGRTDADRSLLLAHAAGLRDEVDAESLRGAITIVQATYFRQGASSHHKWAPGQPGVRMTLYPGPFARRHERLATARPGLDPLPLGRRDADEIRRFLTMLGLRWRMLAAASAEDLFTLAHAPVWARVRALANDESLPDELVAETRATLAGVRDLEQAALALEATLGPRAGVDVAAPPARAPWQSAIQSTLGAMAEHAEDAAAAIILDLSKGTLGGQPLTPAACRVLAVLVVAGEWGVSVEDVLQMEADRAAFGDTGELPTRPLLTAEITIHRHARRQAADQTRHRLSRALETTGARVEVKRGRWRLVCEREIHLTGTAWDEPATASPPDWPGDAEPPGQLGVLWRCLRDAYPGEVALPALALALGRAPDDAGRIYAAKKVAALRVRLRPLAGDIAILGHHRGAYRLVRM
ncbi:hypothetical protein L6V77_25140 [Myxococcota bacterium]|nr:hypothetical protein [Myxococcota bacterium]